MEYYSAIKKNKRMSFAATWMDLEIVILSKVNQKQKGRRHKRCSFNPWVGKVPWRGRHGNPLQYSCLEKPMDRGAWWAAVHRITKSCT